MRVLIVGCGYVGLPLGVELVRQGHEVFGLRRSAAAEAELKRVGLTPLLADITQPESLKNLPRDFDWVVNCAASGGADNYRNIYLEGNRNLVAWLGQSPPKKFIYTSSTSVYAQNDGSVVTEASPTEPDTATSKILVETEKFLLAAAHSNSNVAGVPLNRPPATFSPNGGEGRDEGELVASLKAFPAVILRVAGIYGPARGHSFKQFLRGAARIEGDGARWLNMIHRDDLIGVIIAALERGAPGEIYNAADNEPVSQLKFFEWLAAELQQPMPPRVIADAETWRKRGVTDKRVSNAKLRAELKYEFKFPDFRAGYAAEIALVKKESPRKFHIFRSCCLIFLAFGLAAFLFFGDVDHQGKIFLMAAIGLILLRIFYDLWKAMFSCLKLPKEAAEDLLIEEQVSYFRRLLRLVTFFFPALSLWIIYVLNSNLSDEFLLLPLLKLAKEYLGFWPTVLAFPIIGTLCWLLLKRRLNALKDDDADNSK